MRHLDSNIVVAYLNGHPNVVARVRENLPDLAISTVVMAELVFGALNSARVEKNLQALRDFLRLVELTPFCPRCAETYGHARVALQKKGRLSPSLDLLIGATALAHRAKLVTNNTKHFKHIDGLELEDWLIPA